MPLDLGNPQALLQQARLDGDTLYVSGTAGKTPRFARPGRVELEIEKAPSGASSTDGRVSSFSTSADGERKRR
ncbi:MAG: hypothetical protein ACT4SY_13065 [Hyphomicrobiales bacterium]